MPNEKHGRCHGVTRPSIPRPLHRSQKFRTGARGPRTALAATHRRTPVCGRILLAASNHARGWKCRSAVFDGSHQFGCAIFETDRFHDIKRSNFVGRHTDLSQAPGPKATRADRSYSICNASRNWKFTAFCNGIGCVCLRLNCL